MRLLGREEAVAVLGASSTLGGTYTPDCAALHPARLVRGLAEAVERRGVQIYERTRVTSIEPGLARTESGTLRADHVVRATEGYTPRLPGHSRTVVPVYSLVIATEPLAPEVWQEIGLARRETFSDHRHLIIYGQRTADDRLVFGGRGAPYHFGSRVRPAYDRDQQVFARLYATLLDLFPVLRGTKVTHAWGGPLGIPRDWCASVGLDTRDRARVGRRLRRRRRQHHQPGRPDPARPDPAAGHRAHPAALGRPPLAGLGARAAALARHQRRPPGDGGRRRRGVVDRTTQPGRPGRRAPARLTRRGRTFGG